MPVLKRILFAVLLAVMALPLSAKEQTETFFLFRFVTDRDMFYRESNEAALDSLFQLLDPASLDIGSVRVDGYSRTKALSRTRCNRVKSELIVRRGLREEHFTTQSLTGTFEGRQNIVVVTVPITVSVSLPDESMPVTEDERQDNETETAGLPSVKSAVTKTLSADGNNPETEDSASCSASHGIFSVRANLLHWATLTTDLGIEWYISPSWSLLVNGSWTSWSWNNKNRRYALWEVAPEVRCHIGKEKRGYVGAMYKAGSFNYKFSETGRQGDIMGGGITSGYVLKLNDTLSMDFSLGVGCLHVDYEKYAVIDGVRVRRGTESRNWWGPISAGITLVWTIF